MRLAAPDSLPLSNPLLRLHHPFASQAHQAILGSDTGILLRNTKWIVETFSKHAYATYARVRIPDTEAAVGSSIRLLHLWSIHAPPEAAARNTFWNSDVPELSRIDASSFGSDTAAIIGADWNAVFAPMLDTHPPDRSSPQVPHGILARAGLVDVYRTLHPTSTTYTRYHKVRGQIISARRIDGIAVSTSLVTQLRSIVTRPSLSDHSIVSVTLASSAQRPSSGSGVWRLHREAHLQPGFQLRISQYVSQLRPNLSQTPVQRWFWSVERIRTKASDISTEISQKLQKKAAERQRLVQELNALDIRHGDETRQLFLTLLERLRSMETAEATATLNMRKVLHEANLVRPTAWIIPRLESRTFASLSDIVDDQGTHTDLDAKLVAIHRFYTALFTPSPSDTFTNEASAVLLSSVNQTIASNTRHKLEAPFTVEELRHSLGKAPVLSAPGMDGITYPLLTCIGDPILQQICDLGNALMRGHQLPEGEPTLRGVLLPKKGDLSKLSNYRPLSIATAAFRVLGNTVAARLQPAAAEALHSAQTGFIIGRSSALNLVTLYLLQHAVTTSHVKGPIWILNLDQQKAYDRVRHEWLLDCLVAYGFGPRFLTYIKEIYRHPSVCQSAEGKFTEAIRLACGILQGDPMSCLLYNFSLQPLLDYARNHHHTATTLSWDSTKPLLVSSLAFADDILLVVNGRDDLAKFMDSLDLYEMASNAKVNQDKSQAFFFGVAAANDEQLNESDIPYPVLGDSSAEFFHLGYPFRLDGRVPASLLEKRFATVQAKVNLLAETKTTLFARVQIINSFLLSKLWHSIRLCPLPQAFQRTVNNTTNPFLFLGRRSWLRHEIVVAPRHLGGLGVINADHMAIALLGQIVAGLLLSQEPTGVQFRAALQDLMWKEYKAIPAHLIMRRGIPWRDMNSVLTAQKSFLHRCVYTLCQLRLSVTPDWDRITVKELLALPFHHDMYGYTWPEISTHSAGRWEHCGLRVWGDVLWYNPNEKGKEPHPNSVVRAYPLVPPSASGVKNNYVPSRGHPDTYPSFSDAAGRLIANYWHAMWAALHPTVVAKLTDISKHFRLHPDNSKSSKNPRPHDRPFDIDTVGLPFPWHIATLANKPLKDYTVRHARAFKATDQVVIPDWQFEADSSSWQQVWDWQHKENLLLSEGRSDVYLFLQRRPWLAQKPRVQRRLGDYDVLNQDAIAPRREFLAHDLEEADTVPLPDPYELEIEFGVAACMLCNGPKDSAAHGFVECEKAQKAWREIMPTLRKLVNGKSVPLDLKSVVLGWPSLKMPVALRARLLLWRDLAIHILTRRRFNAISEGLRNDVAPQLDLTTFGSEHAALVAKMITDAYHKCSPGKRGDFVKRWLERGIFLKEQHDTLVFHSMQATTAQQPSTTTSASTTATTT